MALYLCDSNDSLLRLIVHRILGHGLTKDMSAFGEVQKQALFQTFSLKYFNIINQGIHRGDQSALLTDRL